MKVVLIDVSNLTMRCLFSQMPGPEEQEFSIFKLTFMASFMKLLKTLEPERVICLQDSESWRKQVYPEYKANRAAKREQSVVNFDVFFPVLEKFINDIADSFKNIPFVKIPYAEADDCIATIVKNHPDWDIINVSSDRDFYQLFKYPNYRQWDAMKHTFIEGLDPDVELMVKILTGDSSDNIPGLKRGIGPKRALKIINEDVNQWIENEKLQPEYERNMKLISFDCIPKEIELAINDVINNLTYGEPDTKKYFKFIQMSGLAELMNTFTDYVNLVKKVH